MRPKDWRNFRIIFIIFIFFIGLVGVCGLSGCSSSRLAPVVNAWYQTRGNSNTYYVRRGDTIYSIAWGFGLDYRALAARNGLRPPYKILVGQRIKMTTIARGQRYSPPTQARKKIAQKHQVRYHAKRSRPVSRWRWPAKGELKQRFSLKRGGHPGIAIAGRLGEPVRASAAGQIVYSGDGIRGYGNLIIVKHNSSYLSAYAFNQKNLVRVGDRVRLGQLIAYMGQNNAGRTLLYFEIRRDGVPINPLRFLQ